MRRRSPGAGRTPADYLDPTKTAEKPLSNARVDPHGAPAIFRRLRDLSPLTSRCPCGGIGRRARLKIEFRKECWFDSGQGHQSVKSLFFQPLSRLIRFLFWQNLNSASNADRPTLSSPNPTMRRFVSSSLRARIRFLDAGSPCERDRLCNGRVWFLRRSRCGSHCVPDARPVDGTLSSSRERR